MSAPLLWLKVQDCFYADIDDDDEEGGGEGDGAEEGGVSTLSATTSTSATTSSAAAQPLSSTGAGTTTATTTLQQQQQQQAKKKGPQKRFFRQRAHMNPLSDPTFPFPLSPYHVDWHSFYPAYFDAATSATTASSSLTNISPNRRYVEMLDVGCGYGGLVVALAKLFPDKLVMGMEIRHLVCLYVHERIAALRANSTNGEYQNAAVARVNVMKVMVLSSMFSHGIVMMGMYGGMNEGIDYTESMLDEYAYVMKDNGILYTITDVPALHQWMKEKCLSHECFEPLTQQEMDSDPLSKVIASVTEEGIKVERAKGDKYIAIFRRKPREQVLSATVM